MLSHLASAHLIPLLLPNKLENPSRSVRLSLDCQQVAFHEWEFFWPKDVPGVAKGDSSKLCKENTELQQNILVWFETCLFFFMQLHSFIQGRGRLTPQCLQLSSHPNAVRHCSVTPDHSSPRAHHAMCGGAVTMEGWQALALEQKITEARCLPCNRETEVQVYFLRQQTSAVSNFLLQNETGPA